MGHKATCEQSEMFFLNMGRQELIDWGIGAWTLDDYANEYAEASYSLADGEAKERQAARTVEALTPKRLEQYKAIVLAAVKAPRS